MLLVYLRDEIEELLAPDEQLQRINEIHAHCFGPYMVINITICVDGILTETAGNQIATDVEKDLMTMNASVH